MARIGTKQNAAKEAQIVNPIKPPDFGWLNVDRYAEGGHDLLILPALPPIPEPSYPYQCIARLTLRPFDEAI